MNYLDEQFEKCIVQTASVIITLLKEQDHGTFFVGVDPFGDEIGQLSYSLDREAIYGSFSDLDEISGASKIAGYNIFNYGVGNKSTGFRFYVDTFWKTSTGKLFIKRVREMVSKHENVKLSFSWGGLQTLIKIKFRR